MGEGLGGFCLQCPPTLVPQMAAARRCLSLLFLSTCVALLLQPPLGASGAPLEPVYPGDNATPEQLAQYAAELRRYINMLTRPRCVQREGERSRLLPLPRSWESRTTLLARPGPVCPWRMGPKGGQEAGGLAPGHSARLPQLPLLSQIREKRPRRNATELLGVGSPQQSCPQVGLVPRPVCQLPGAEMGVEVR